MRKTLLPFAISSTLVLWSLLAATAQNSVLVNFGSITCSNSLAPQVSLIKNPLGASPLVLASCSMSPLLPDYYSVFVAYNPADNKFYIVDNRTGLKSDIWKIDMGLPQKIECPASISTTPTYSYPYVSNNFEFDNNGDLWSLSEYNAATGQCKMDKFDINTGAIINTRVLQFPAGNFPMSVTSGDLTILPNGRMFATLGSTPSRLYEILNYNSTSGSANAVYLQTLPKDCYGIAYLNGLLEITGTNMVNSCYYFTYSIGDNTLSGEKTFQNSQAPIDNASIAPVLGTTKRLINEVVVNSNTSDLTYEIYVRNMGNVVLNDINVTDDLVSTFGTDNFSNVQISFVPGSNAAGLTLNPAYNGTTVTSMLNTGQSLPNQTLTNTNYFFKIQLQCRVTNLLPNHVYYNSAIGMATINNDIDKIIVSDSSNNGPSSVVDPNNDGNASGIGENVPTPYSIGVLPVNFLSANARLVNNWRDARIEWSVAAPLGNAQSFDVEYSRNGKEWKKIWSQPAISQQYYYQALHGDVPQGKLFYRVRENDSDGKSVYSSVMVLNNNAANAGLQVYPNPASNETLIRIGNNNAAISVDLYDAFGRKVLSASGSQGTVHLNTSLLPNGNYLVKCAQHGLMFTEKLVVWH